MSIHETAHLVIMFMCLCAYLLYGVFDKIQMTLFQFLIVLGIALTPILNVIFTLWLGIYLIHDLLSDLINKISEINKKAFAHDSILARKSC